MEAKFRAELQRDVEETRGPKKKFEAHGGAEKIWEPLQPDFFRNIFLTTAIIGSGVYSRVPMLYKYL